MPLSTKTKEEARTEAGGKGGIVPPRTRLGTSGMDDPFPKGVERIFDHFGKIWAFSFVLCVLFSIAVLALIVAAIVALV